MGEVTSQDDKKAGEPEDAEPGDSSAEQAKEREAAMEQSGEENAG